MKVEDKDLVIRELSDLRFKEGYSRKSLIEYLQDKYNLKITRCYELIQEMYQKTADAYNKTNVDALSNSVSFLEQLQQSALEEGDKKLALDIQKEIDKVQQLHIQKLEIEAKTIEGVNINIKKSE